MESLWEQCLKVHISKTKSAEVFELHGQVSHVEMLNILKKKNGSNSATMWSIIIRFGQ